MSFIFDANKQAAPSSLRAARYALATNPPKDIGSGIQSIAQALMMRNQQYPSAPAGNPLVQAAGRMGSLFGLGQRGLY
ncbi:MAG: hypothetical protein M9945_12745 [Aquamicrobium sp.]|uniref:hypothetical protein n=1 Tax=Aquamicrobium sp. TaxID=1872579 RepID=UPI00349EFF1A|nr:hypothetical protein [Aquamicrobium sp.]